MGDALCQLHARMWQPSGRVGHQQRFGSLVKSQSRLHSSAGGKFWWTNGIPFVVRRGNNYYLFVCDNEWTDVYVSNDPFRWDFTQKNTFFLAHASEIVRDTDGRWFISHAGWTSGPLKITPSQMERRRTMTHQHIARR